MNQNLCYIYSFNLNSSSDVIFPDLALYVLVLFKICTYLIIYKQAVTKIEIRHLAKAQKSLASRPKISRTRESRPKKVQTNKYQINNPVFVVMIIIYF